MINLTNIEIKWEIKGLEARFPSKWRFLNSNLVRYGDSEDHSSRSQSNFAEVRADKPINPVIGMSFILEASN